MSKSARQQALVKFLTKVLKVKIGLSPELMNYSFEFIEKLCSLPINSQFRLEGPNDKTWYRNI